MVLRPIGINKVQQKLESDRKGEEELLKLLMTEVKSNGYGGDLKTSTGDSLLVVVDEKLKHHGILL